MSAEANLKTVQGIYEAFGTGDVDAILEQVTDDVDWSADAATDTAPWYGPRKGKDGVATFFSDIAGATEVLDFEPRSFAANDDEVMVLIRSHLKIKPTGKETDMNLHHYWHFTDGKVDTYRGSEDTAQAVEAFQA
jgi:uncharacterized protein